MHVRPGIEHAAFATKEGRQSLLSDSRDNHLREMDRLRQELRDTKQSPLRRKTLLKLLRRQEESYAVLRKAAARQDVRIPPADLVFAQRELRAARAMIR